MKVTLLELFSIVDGRLSTKMDDVYRILAHLTGYALFTHQLPSAMDIVKENKPQWFFEAEKEINGIKAKIGNDFKALVEFIKENQNTIYEIEPLKK